MSRQSSDSSLLRAALLILLGVLLGLVVILVAARLLGGQWLQCVKAVPSASVLHTPLMQSFLEELVQIDGIQLEHQLAASKVEPLAMPAQEPPRFHIVFDAPTHESLFADKGLRALWPFGASAEAGGVLGRAIRKASLCRSFAGGLCPRRKNQKSTSDVLSASLLRLGRSASAHRARPAAPGRLLG